MEQILLILMGLLLGNQYCAAQSGYSYARPEVSGGGQNLQTSGNPAVRPIVGGGGGFPTAVTGAGAFPTAATAYGVTGGGGGTVNPASAYAGFPAQAQQGGTATSLYNPGAVGSTGYAAGQKRPVIPQQQRPATGIYGAVPQQFGVSAAARGGATGTGSGFDNDYAEGDYSAIPGVPGVNYPIYAEVPPTNFDCSQQALPGYYSDIEAQCQVFHICALNRTYSFLCPNGTIFSQETLVCVWWNQYDCVSAPSLYANNAFIYDFSSQGGNSAPTVGGYQPTNVAQVNLAANRPQTNFLALPNAARATNTAAGTSIYGSGNLRSSVATNAYGGGQAGFPAISGNAASAGRYAPNPAQAQAAATYATGSAAASPTAFGGAIRNEGFSNAIQENAYSAAQVSSKAANREYLPPGRP